MKVGILHLLCALLLVSPFVACSSEHDDGTGETEYIEIPYEGEEDCKNSTQAAGDINVSFNRSICFFIQPNTTLKNDTTFLFVKKFALLPEDNMILTVEDQKEPLFKDEKFQGYKDPFMIITGVKNLMIKITATDKDVKTVRMFEVYYTTQPDKMKNPVSMSSGSITSPIYKPSNTTFSMKLKLRPLDSNTMLAFSFYRFNITKGSLTVDNSGTGQPIEVKGDNLVDILSKPDAGIDFQLQMDLNVPNQGFVLAYEPVAKACSKYIDLKAQKPDSIDSPQKSDVALSTATGIKCMWIISRDSDDDTGSIGIDMQNLKLSSQMDTFDVKDGPRQLSPSIVHVSQLNLDESRALYVRSSSNKVVVSFVTYLMNPDSSFSLPVRSYSAGKRYTASNGTLTVKVDSSASPDDTVYLIDVTPGQQAYLELDKDCTSSGSLEFYDGFSRKSSLLANLTTKDPVYPIVSTGNQLMIIPKQMGGSCSAKYSTISQGCHFISLPGDASGTLNFHGTCNETCSWIIPPKTPLIKNSILALRFTYLSLDMDAKVKIETLRPERKTVAIVHDKEHQSYAIPVMYLDPTKGAYMSIQLADCPPPAMHTEFLKASYDIEPPCKHDLKMSAGEKLEVTSPYYPDTYPLNADCSTNISVSEPSDLVLLTFKSLELAPGHVLQIQNPENGSIIEKYDSNRLRLPDDLLLPKGALLHFASPSNSTSNAVGRGFSADVLSADCGGVLQGQDQGTISTPGFPNATQGLHICAWLIEVPLNNKAKLVNIISFNVTMGKGGDSSDLKIYDGASIRAPILANLTGPDALSRTNTIIVLYNVTENGKGAAEGLEIQYESYACQNQCSNGICMHRDWVCNGKDDCGDWSDELRCNGTFPTPEPSPSPQPSEGKGNGVSPVAVGILVPLAFVLGIVATIFFPVVVRRLRAGQYSHFSNAPEVA